MTDSSSYPVTEREFLEDNIATVAFHLGQPGARLSVSHDGPGLVVDPGEVLKEISRRLSGVAQAPLGPCTQAELDAWEKHLDKKDAQLLLMWVDRALKAEAALVMSATTRETPEPLTACAKCQNTGWCHGQGWCQNSGVALSSTEETCSCVGAVIGSHDSSCPYAISSTDGATP